MNTTTRFRLAPISPADADVLRATGGPSYVAASNPGYPCRQCLRDAEIGDELILVSHDPFTLLSPYRCASPIFLHAQPCTSAAAPGDAASDDVDDHLPSQLTVRQLSVRAFDDQAMMIDAAIIDGLDLDVTLHRFFTDDATEQVHVHNASRGCWAVSVVRA